MGDEVCEAHQGVFDVGVGVRSQGVHLLIVPDVSVELEQNVRITRLSFHFLQEIFLIDGGFRCRLSLLLLHLSLLLFLNQLLFALIEYLDDELLL